MRTTATWIVAAVLAAGITYAGALAKDAPTTQPASGESAVKPAKKPAAKPAKKPGPKKPTTQPDANDVQIEAESLKLTDCDVIDANDASKGKCIRITKETSKAEGTVKLKAGTWQVEAYVKCEDLSHDAFHLKIGEGAELKVFPSHARLPQKDWWRAPVESDVKPPPQYTFKLDKDASVKIVISPRETGMLVDRFIFRKMP